MEVDLNTKCRICLGDSGDMHFLFGQFDQDITLKEVFTETTTFEISENDGFSPFLCDNCTNIVINFYNLKIIYKENQAQLRNLLGGEIEDKTEEEELENEEIDLDDCESIKIEVEDTNQLDETEEDSAEIILPEILKNYQKIVQYTCPQCNKQFGNRNLIQTHLVTKHKISNANLDALCEVHLVDISNNQPQGPKIVCKLCNEQFRNDDAFNEHFECHKKYICDVCGARFVKNSYLKDHSEVHRKEKTHVCCYCNKAFQRRTVLIKHKRIHTNPRQCVCEVCGKAFNDNSTLKTHILMIHVKARNFECGLCGLRFSLKATLEKHIRRHGKRERNFSCSYCSSAYKDKSSLDRHVAHKHHGEPIQQFDESDEYRTCVHCGQQYWGDLNLLKHQKVAHDV